ncbi:precorrin-3B synthase [Tolypothrix sp. FACHB-123]|uniref:precorrin-3B synthase n=1 Tax=Tolypothrix sp. FACHB-123 TaxID=2692868 RepID=UPI0016837169|nr:precorrin-3B synthase [Tolypothrix sp. FACHB-123]MBD2353350.1 precorrin-3B synthase [Tolypothrix sp. FACHB-123]
MVIYIPALHGEGVLVLLSSGFTKCPGLFYATPAQDGILSRIRIPGGILNSQQCRAIAEIAEQYGGGYIDVTNRANLQVREIHQGIDGEVLQRLQALGLGCSNTTVDQIRNIMTSPTAGIDPQELIDTCPFVTAWDNYITANTQLSALSAKFSVCFDGGGIVSVSDRINDIVFAAVLIENEVYFRLCLSIGAKGKPAQDTGIIVTPEQCLPVLAALADVYLAHLEPTTQYKLRLRELLNNIGWENYLQQVQQRLDFPLSTREIETAIEKIAINYHHIGIHPQRQPNLYYFGVVLPLGRLETMQILGLAELAEKYGSGTVRLTPWQNLLLTDIPQIAIADVQRKIDALGLDCTVSNISAALVSCSGKKGCAASATDTKGDAFKLAEYLKTHIALDSPVNIHFSGCTKSCAQHHQSDITLLGVSVEEDHKTVEGYRIYIGVDNNEQKFGREYQFVTVAKLPALIEEMLLVYKTQRLNLNETFREFAHRYDVSQWSIVNGQ